MKKKVLSVLLCTAMVATMAAGCGSDSAETTKTDDTAKTDNAAKDDAATDDAAKMMRKKKAVCTSRSYPRASSMHTGRQY
ncbi:MAG: hypothetical protein ACLTA7_01800 [Ruminococcus sp.]